VPGEPSRTALEKQGAKTDSDVTLRWEALITTRHFFETRLIENASIRCVPVGVLPADGETGIDSVRIDSGGQLRRDSLLSMWVVQ
jgi:hypothetical protein